MMVERNILLKIEAACSSETLININQTIHYIRGQGYTELYFVLCCATFSKLLLKSKVKE
jgi:hypothetical protein